MTLSNSLRSEATFKGYYTYPMEKLYMLTISKHQKLSYVLPCDIYSVLQSLKADITSLIILDQSLETTGLYSQLHFHGLVSINEFFKFKNFKTINGFQLSWKTINNLCGALNYIYKDTHKKDHVQDQIIALNTYTHKKAPNLFL